MMRGKGRVDITRSHVYAVPFDPSRVRTSQRRRPPVISLMETFEASSTEVIGTTLSLLLLT